MSLDGGDVLRVIRRRCVLGGIYGRRIGPCCTVGERCRCAARQFGPTCSLLMMFVPLGAVTPEVGGPAIGGLVCEPRSEELMNTPERSYRDGDLQKLRSEPCRLLEEPLAESRCVVPYFSASLLV